MGKESEITGRKVRLIDCIHNPFFKIWRRGVAFLGSHFADHTRFLVIFIIDKIGECSADISCYAHSLFSVFLFYTLNPLHEGNTAVHG